jgi:hypothetical protein
MGIRVIVQRTCLGVYNVHDGGVYLQDQSGDERASAQQSTESGKESHSSRGGGCSGGGTMR